MKWHIFAVVAIFGLLNNEAASNPVVLEFKTACDTASAILKVVTGAKSAVDMAKDLTGQATTLSGLKEVMLERMDNLEAMVSDIPEDIQQAAQIDDDLRQIFNEMSEINRLYQSYYLHYLNNTISDPSLKEFYMKATSIHADGPDKRVQTIFNIICPGELSVVKSGFMQRLVKQLNTREHQRCKILEGSQQYIYQLWSLIGIIEFRAFSMITTAYKLRALETNDDHSLDITRIDQEHNTRMEKYLITIKNAITTALTIIARCAPTYEESNALITFNSMSRKPKYISLLEAKSDHKSNKVVTGIKFVVENSMLFLRVEQGLLMAGGRINSVLKNWVPTGVQKLSNQDPYYLVTEDENRKLIEKVDYEKTIYRYSYIHLEDVHTDCVDCVIIGVKLAMYDLTTTRIYYLVVSYVEADMDTGIIKENSERFIKAYKPNPDDLKNQQNNPLLFNIDTTTSVKYFDSNGIYTDPRLPLSGVGISVVPDSKHGSALAFHVFNTDLSPRIKPEL